MKSEHHSNNNSQPNQPTKSNLEEMLVLILKRAIAKRTIEKMKGTRYHQ